MPASITPALRQSVFGLATLCMLACARAAVVTLTPVSAVVTSGATLTVDITVSGLASSDDLGGFDLDIAFNPALVSFTGASYGLRLGDPTAFEALTNAVAAGGVVDFSEVSLLSPAQLGALQPASFSLGTLSFSGLGTGTAGFALLGTSLLSDAVGRAIPISPAALPEPGTLALVGAGLAGWMLAPRRSARGRGRPRTEPSPVSPG